MRSRSVDLAVANITAQTIVELAGEMARVLTPGGVAVEEVLEKDEWLAFVC
ncbi:MAG: hypothetical protein AAB225_26595 [Acidobacteriota bacterium]